MSSSVKNERSAPTYTIEQYNSIIIESERSHRVSKITPYKGQCDPSVINEWISQTESFFRPRFTDNRYWASAAFDLSLFAGPANTWARDGLNDVRASCGPNVPLITWKSFCDAMREFFIPEAVERAIEAKVYSMKQSNTGSVIQFVADLRNCLYLLRPEVKRNINVKQIFFHGLDFEMRDKLEVFYDSSSADDLMQRALRMCHEEGRWKFNHYYDPNKTEMTLADPLAVNAIETSPESSVDVNNVNYNRNNSRSRNYRGSNKGRNGNNQKGFTKFPADIVCFKCKGKGHISRVCPSKKNNGSSSNSNSNSSPKNDENQH